MSIETPTPVVTNPAMRLTRWVDRHRWWILGGVLVVFLLGFNGKWRIEADSALYLSLGRNLAEGRGYTYHGQTNSLAYPGLPWLHAGLFKVFGTDTLVPQHLMMLLIALATLGLIYRLFWLHDDRATALVMIAGMAGVKTFFRFAFELRNDMPFTLGTLAFLCGWEALAQRHRRPVKPFDYFLLVSGFTWAMFMRPTIWALVLALAIAGVVEAIRRPKLRWRFGLVLLAIGAFVVVFRYFDPRSAEESASQYERYVFTSFTTNLRSTLNHVWMHNIPILLKKEMSDTMFQSNLSYGNIVLSLLIIVLGIGLVRQRLLWGAWVGVTILMMAAVLPLDRIALPILPLLVYGWWRFIVWVCEKVPGLRFKWAMLAALLAVGLGNNGSRIGGYMLVQHARHFYQVYDKGEHLPIVQACEQLKHSTPPNSAVLIAWNYAREASFLSRRDVYDRSDLSMLNLGDRPCYLVEPGDAATQRFILENRLEPGSQIAPKIRLLKWAR